MIKKEPKLDLSPRLLKIADILPYGQSVADIGTDHGYIPIFAVLDKGADFAVASDVKKGPLKRAKENIDAFGLSEKISLRLGSGLNTLEKGEVSVIVVAGMGGILISEIIDASIDVVHSAKKLILQPMTAVRELRQYLLKNGFVIEEEFLVSEEDKIYNILLVGTGKDCDYSEKELVLGRYGEDTDPKLLNIHKEQILKKMHIKQEGLLKAKRDGREKEIKELKRLISLIKE